MIFGNNLNTPKTPYPGRQLPCHVVDNKLYRVPQVREDELDNKMSGQVKHKV